MYVALSKIRHQAFVSHLKSCSNLRYNCRGFTMVELLVATIVMSFTLLGVYTVFRQALSAEESVSSKWRDRASANAVADHLADSIRHVVILPDLPPVVAGKSETEVGQELVCMYGGSRPTPLDPARAAIEQRRYHWGFQDSRAGSIFLQKIPMAGTTDIGVEVNGEELNVQQRWALVQPVVIAESINSVDVSYRPLDQPESTWQVDWQDAQTPVLVRVRVVVGEYQAERYVAPMVRGSLVQTEGG